jgi:hypothetical protein
MSGLDWKVAIDEIEQLVVQFITEGYSLVFIFFFFFFLLKK